MSHTWEDFAQADFARHPDGRKAMRREGVRTQEPWISMTKSSSVRYSDADMAARGWVVVGSVPDDSRPTMIREPYDLRYFQNQYRMRDDWHEPGEQNIGARIIGNHLDNAMGSTVCHENTDWGGEFNVVLQHLVYDHDTNDYDRTDLAVVNLATLLSWAAEHGECQR